MLNEYRQSKKVSRWKTVSLWARICFLFLNKFGLFDNGPAIADQLWMIHKIGQTIKCNGTREICIFIGCILTGHLLLLDPTAICELEIRVRLLGSTPVRRPQEAS